MELCGSHNLRQPAKKTPHLNETTIELQKVYSFFFLMEVHQLLTPPAPAQSQHSGPSVHCNHISKYITLQMILLLLFIFYMLYYITFSLRLLEYVIVKHSMTFFFPLCSGDKLKGKLRSKHTHIHITALIGTQQEAEREIWKEKDK